MMDVSVSIVKINSGLCEADPVTTKTTKPLCPLEKHAKAKGGWTFPSTTEQSGGLGLGLRATDGKIPRKASGVGSLQIDSASAL